MNFEIPLVSENQPQNEKYDFTKVLDEIESTLFKTEEEKNQYIIERLNILNENAESGEISASSLSERRIHSGFIGSKMEVVRNLMCDPLVIDDPELYNDFLKEIEKFKGMDSFKDKPLKDIILNIVQWTIMEYFGNYVASKNTDSLNQKIYNDHSSSDGPISIKDFKGRGIAVCAEKAAAAQNLLAFSGMRSDLIASHGCRLPADKKPSGHYYILIHGPEGEIIYDPTNPRILYGSDDSIKSLLPATYAITDEQMKSLLSKGSVVVEHKDGKEDENSQIIPEVHSRLYEGNR
jgi:hypothetical protein